uniref:Uncharacterized protein n=1 Tax=Leersia perrieri TaxID=77586 RepID=A0A0D9VQ18_9ORYZ
MSAQYGPERRPLSSAEATSEFRLSPSLFRFGSRGIPSGITVDFWSAPATARRRRGLSDEGFPSLGGAFDSASVETDAVNLSNRAGMTEAPQDMGCGCQMIGEKIRLHHEISECDMHFEAK